MDCIVTIEVCRPSSTHDLVYLFLAVFNQNVKSVVIQIIAHLPLCYFLFSKHLTWMCVSRAHRGKCVFLEWCHSIPFYKLHKLKSKPKFLKFTVIHLHCLFLLAWEDAHHKLISLSLNQLIIFPLFFTMTFFRKQPRFWWDSMIQHVVECFDSYFLIYAHNTGI